MEARTQTIREFVGELFAGCDLAAGLKRVVTFVETLADQMPAIIERVLIPACEMFERLDKLPPAPGYEPMLIERGHHPLIARGLSYGIIRLGKEEACPSSDDLRQFGCFRKGGSGSSVVEIMRHAVDAANDDLRWSGV